MFEVPDAKRVRREDLYSPRTSQSRSPSPASSDHTAAVLAALNETAQFTLNTSSTSQEQTTVDHILEAGIPRASPAHNEPNDEAYAFPLFRAAPPSDAKRPQDAQPANAPLIRLSSPSDDAPQTRKRPLSYYLWTPSSAAKSHYETAAVSGTAVRQAAHIPCPGLRMPWRVVRVAMPLSTTQPTFALDATTDGRDTHERRRCRAGKKTRLKLRARLRSQEAKKAEKATAAERAIQQAEEKEQHLREKKAAMNRRKQLKRRERERERKASGIPKRVMASAVPGQDSRDTGGSSSA